MACTPAGSPMAPTAVAPCGHAGNRQLECEDGRPLVPRNSRPPVESGSRSITSPAGPQGLVTRSRSSLQGVRAYKAFASCDGNSCVGVFIYDEHEARAVYVLRSGG
jgi:hypothetical protein